MSRLVVEIPVEAWEKSLEDIERLTASYREGVRLMEQVAALQAENERLRKAGDYCCMIVNYHLNGQPYSWLFADNAVKSWHAAKGVQS